MSRIKMTMICEEEQIRLIMKALEQFERLRIGQAWDFAEDIAFDGYHYSRDDKEEFDKRIDVRNDLKEDMERIINRALRKVGKEFGAKTDEVLSIEDLWIGLRYQCFVDLLTPEEQEERKYTVNSRTPFGDGLYPLAKIKLERLDDDYNR